MTPSRPVPPVRDREEAIKLVEGFLPSGMHPLFPNHSQPQLAERIVDALLGQPDPEVERLREQVRELLTDIELLEKDQDPPSVSRTARKLRHHWIDDAFTQRQLRERAEERLRAVTEAARKALDEAAGSTKESSLRLNGRLVRIIRILRAVLSEQDSLR